MSKFIRLLGILGLVIAGVACAVIWEAKTARRRQAELAAFRRQQTDLASLRQENRDLVAKQISAEDLGRLHREHDEEDRLRRLIAASRSHPSSEAMAPVDDNRAMVPSSDWKFAGKATPKAAFESVLWAATRQDIDSLATLLSFDPKARAAADGFFAQLPDEVRAQYGSPEKIAATMLAATMPANLSAMGELSENVGPDNAMLLMGVQRGDGTQKDTAFQFHRGTDGWQLLVPPGVMEAYLRKLGAPLSANQ